MYITPSFTQNILKFLCGLYFYLFLKKVTFSDYAALIGAIYMLSVDFYIRRTMTLFSTHAVYVALLLYSFEKTLSG